MILTPYQIAVPLVSLVAVLYAWNLALRQKKTIWEALLWSVFWGAVAFVALEPGALTYLSVITGVKSQANAFFATAIGILFFFMFYMIVRNGPARPKRRVGRGDSDGCCNAGRHERKQQHR